MRVSKFIPNEHATYADQEENVVEGLEVVVLLGASVLIGAVLAPRLRLAPPLVLLVIGLLLGFVPSLREIQLPPETVLLIFLPVMLFWESLTTSLRSIRRDFRGIVLMSTLLVVATAFAVAGIAYWLGLPWNVALILGAALAPPDATAVAALGRMLPRRNFMLLKAESLTNDATALVLYAIAVGVTLGGTYTPLNISFMVLLSYVGGMLAGAIVASTAYLIMRSLTDALTINIALLITPFAAFLLAEVIHASGVLAVVVAGLIVSYTSSIISTAGSRRQTESAWPLGSYLLNGALFVLIGLQVQAVARDIGSRDVSRLLLITVAVWVALVVVRFAFQSITAGIIRGLDRRPSQRQRRMSYRARIVSSIAGFRGAVSLAIALSVPSMLDNGQALPGRDDIVFITAGVIVLTLLVQGPVLPAVVRWADLPPDTEDEERRLAERALNTAALVLLGELSNNPAERDLDNSSDQQVDDNPAGLSADDSGVNLRIHSDARDRLIHEYRIRLELMAAPNRDGEQQPNPTNVPYDDLESLDKQDKSLRLMVLAREREVLTGLLHDGTIDDTIARNLRARLDVEEQRLTGLDPIE